MSRDYIQLRATSDREFLLARAKDAMGIEEDSKAIDEALRRAVSFDDLQEWVRDTSSKEELKQIDMEHHSITVRTALTRR